MAGLLAWAADVVGGGGGGGGSQINENDDESIPIIYTPDQQRYVNELQERESSLRRVIKDLRLRIPPPDISQRLPHLHAHSLASNAALALQLNSHSSTKQLTQLREITLQEENAAYEKAISNCESKIQEKIQEAESLRQKLMQMDEDEKILKAELEKAQTASDTHHSETNGESVVKSQPEGEAEWGTEDLKSSVQEKLENKKKELGEVGEMVQELEKRWSAIQDSALKQPSPAQREKTLDKQLHSLLEQLAAKQSQAEALVNDIHVKQMELEELNGFSKNLETSSVEINTARNRFGRNISEKGSAYGDYIIDPHHKPHSLGGRTESIQRPVLFRSAFVLYILALHILVFIKISF